MGSHWEFCSRPLSGSSFNSRGRRAPLPVPLGGDLHVRVSKIWLETAATTNDNGPKDAAGERPRQGGKQGRRRKNKNHKSRDVCACDRCRCCLRLLLFASVRCTPMQTFSSRSLSTGARGARKGKTPSPSPCPPTVPCPSHRQSSHSGTRTHEKQERHLPWPTCRSRLIDRFTTPHPSPRLPL
jgi:hypothetical protein